MEFPHKLRQFVAWHRRALAAALAGLGAAGVATAASETDTLQTTEEGTS